MRLSIAVTGAQAVRRELGRLSAVPRLALDRTVEDVEDYIGEEAGRHTKTGRLFASVTKRREPAGWFVGHDTQVAPHALFVHWGTKPHLIKPRNKKALRWPAGNKFAFAKVVHHPGYKGDPWLVRAAAVAATSFDRHVQTVLAQEALNANQATLR